jgi:Dolichyl-phosphate-mannose-protein mannosyltransferase
VITAARRPIAAPRTLPATIDVRSRVGWGALVVLSSGAGLLCIGLADAASRTGSDAALPLFWLGILGLVAPLTQRLLARTRWIRGHERVADEVPEAVGTATGAIGEDVLGRRVVVEGRVVGPPQPSRDGARFAVDDGSGSVAVVASHASMRGAPVAAGSTVRVAGTVSVARARRRARGYRITATLPDDVLLPDVEGDALRASAGRRLGRNGGAGDREAAARVEGPLRRARSAVRLGPSRDERVLLVVGTGLALYVARVMTSPIAFVGPDEFSHWRTLEDIVRTGHLFASNPLLPVSSIYPGLEAAAATATLSSGLDVFPVAIVLIGLARLVTLLAIFLLAERITGSARTAGIASIIYMANPSFLAFDVTFSYESLALPLALVAIWATLRWTERRGRSWLFGSVALAAIAATVVTHHLTSVVLLGFLSIWAVVSLVRDRRRAVRWPIALAALVALACDAAWLWIAGTYALAYLTGILGGGITQLLGVLTGSGEAKQLFVPKAGFTAPLPEVVVAYGAVGLLVLSLPVVLWHALRSHRPRAIELVLVLAALAYPGSLALRLTAAGSEASQRASEFLFLGLAILVADWLVGLRPARFRPRPAAALLTLLLVFAGGIVAGNPLIERLPGPYHVAAESRSIEPEGRSLAAWMLAELGPDVRLVADRTNAKLLGSIGLAYPVMAANSHLGTAYAMFAHTLGPSHIDTLRQGGVRYVIVDLRLAQDVPVYAYVFEQAEPDGGRHTTPMPLEALLKWDTLPGVRRIYDSGDLIVYDIQAYLDAQP